MPRLAQFEVLLRRYPNASVSWYENLGLYACDYCGDIFLPDDGGEEVYVDRYVHVSMRGWPECDVMNAPEGWEDCPCHRLPYAIPVAVPIVEDLPDE